MSSAGTRVREAPVADQAEPAQADNGWYDDDGVHDSGGMKMRTLSEYGMPVAMFVAAGITTVGVWLLASADGSSATIVSGLSLVITGAAAIVLGLSALARRSHHT